MVRILIASQILTLYFSCGNTEFVGQSLGAAGRSSNKQEQPQQVSDLKKPSATGDIGTSQSPVVIGGCNERTYTEILAKFGEDLNTAASDAVRISNSEISQTASAEFIGQFTGIETEDFEKFAHGNTPKEISFSATKTTIETNATVHSVASGTFNGAFPTSGEKFLLLFGGANSFRLSFDSPQVVFGFSATDVADGNANLSVKLERADGTVHNVDVPHSNPSPTGSRIFMGIADLKNPFIAIELNNSNATFDGFGFDDLLIGKVDQVTRKGCDD